MEKQSDHLDNEVSVKAELTEAGGELRARSRLVSGLDRLGGNFAELLNAPMERRTARIRGEIKLIDEAVAAKIARIRAAAQPADEADLKNLESNARRLTNETEAIVVALEDLSARPPTDNEQKTGPEKLSDEFLDRWERYAEDASTEDLRAKWGKVLAAEIRHPGRISRRTMRAVDELPPDVALKFEELCRHRLGYHLPRCLVGELPFDEAEALSFYGLMVEPGVTGHVVSLDESTDGDKVWVYLIGDRALGVPVSATKLWTHESAILKWRSIDPAGPGIKVYVLTPVGRELASIFEDHTDMAWRSFIDALLSHGRKVGGCEIHEYRRMGDSFRRVHTHRETGEQAAQ